MREPRRPVAAVLASGGQSPQRMLFGKAEAVEDSAELTEIGSMAEIRDNEIMRKMIEESGWYPLLQGEHRQKRIEQDVEMHWHLMRWEAVKRLEQKRQLLCKPANHEADS